VGLQFFFPVLTALFVFLAKSTPFFFSPLVVIYGLPVSVLFPPLGKDTRILVRPQIDPSYNLLPLRNPPPPPPQKEHCFSSRSQRMDPPPSRLPPASHPFPEFTPFTGKIIAGPVLRSSPIQRRSPFFPRDVVYSRRTSSSPCFSNLRAGSVFSFSRSARLRRRWVHFSVQ